MNQSGLEMAVVAGKASPSSESPSLEERMKRAALREKMLQVREEAIVSAVNRLLAQKGFDHMTVDEVAAEAGIAKAILYKHFASKEALAAAAIVRVLDRALQTVDTLRLNAAAAPLDQLKALVRWVLRVQLDGEMPTLPAQNSALRAALLADSGYVDRLMRLSDHLGEWIVAAQSARTLDSTLPSELILYRVFASACDPVLALLKAGGNHDDDAIVEMLVAACFGGLCGVRQESPFAAIAA
jgi:AcrR family transcriptional regulator